MSIAIAGAVSSGLKTVAGGMGRNAAIMEASRKYGVAMANTEYTLGKQLEAGTQSALTATENSSIRKAQISMNQAQAQAATEIEAAASGTTGGSVDRSVQQTQFNAEWAKVNEDKRLSDELASIEQATVSATTSTISSMPMTPSASMSSPLLRGSLSGLMSYGMLGGFS